MKLITRMGVNKLPFRLEISPLHQFEYERQVFHSIDYTNYDTAVEASKKMLITVFISSLQGRLSEYEILDYLTAEPEEPDIIAIYPDTIPLNVETFSASKFSTELIIEMEKEMDILNRWIMNL